MSDWSNCEPTNYKFNGLLFQQKKTKQQNSDCRSRANVLPAWQQRVRKLEPVIAATLLSAPTGDLKPRPQNDRLSSLWPIEYFWC